MALLTVQEISRSGLGPTYASAAGGGDTFANDGRTMVHIKNGGGAPITLTAVTPLVVDGLAVADLTVTVTNGQERMVGPFPVGTFNDPATGQVALTYSGVTSVTVGVFRLP